MFKTFSAILGTLSVLFLFACGGNLVEEPLDRGYDYFPLTVGSYHVYQMDSVIFDPVIGGIEQQTVSLQVKEVVVDTFRDETNVLLYKTERYERPDENHEWEFKSIFAKGTDEDQAIYLTENLRFIKFIFPPRKYKRWNGNVHFDEFRIVEVAGEPMEIFKSWEYEITEEGKPFIQDPFEFDEVTTVMNADYEGIIEYRYVIEKYARGVGLVYREMKILDSQCVECCDRDLNLCKTIPWEDRAEAGFILKQRLIDYN